MYVSFYGQTILSFNLIRSQNRFVCRVFFKNAISNKKQQLPCKPSWNLMPPKCFDSMDPQAGLEWITSCSLLTHTLTIMVLFGVLFIGRYNSPRHRLSFQYKTYNYEPEANVVAVCKLQLSSLSDVSNYHFQHYGVCAVKKQIKRLHATSVKLFLCATKRFHSWICFQDCQ